MIGKKFFVHYIIASVMVGMISIANAETFVRDDIIIDPIPSRFNICHGGTCEDVSNVSLDERQWQLIRNVFINNQTAQKERQNIQYAIAIMETLVGRLTDTYNDQAENISDQKLNHYMDCIDESTNTTIYMRMMLQDGLIRWHSIEDRETRGFFFKGWPHTTAVIKETHNGNQYAIDSWFRTNGQPPYVISLEEWNNGWRPN